MKEEYKDSVDQIHAPKDLIERTKRALKQEEQNSQPEKLEPKDKINIAVSNANTSKKPYDFRWKKIVIAAAVCLVLYAGGVGYYQSNNQISINSVTFSEDNSFGTGRLLGKEDEEKGVKEVSEKEDNSNEEDNSFKDEDSNKVDNLNRETDSDKTDNIQIFKLEEKDEIVDTLLAMTPSKIGREKVYIGAEKETGTFYACLDKKQVYYLIIGNEIGEDGFIQYLKENIKKL